MKILQVSPYFHPHVGGVESHVRDLSEHLMKRGHQVDVATSTHEKGLSPKDQHRGVNVYRLKSLGVWFSTPITLEITPFILKNDYDIVHTHWPPPLDSFFVSRARKRGGPPHVLTYHCDLELKVPLGRLAVSLYNLTFFNWTTKYVDAGIVTTRGYGATSRSVWDKRSFVIPNAVDATVFNPNNSGDEIRRRYQLGDAPLMLYVGRLVHHKGIEHLVESLVHLPKEVKLLVVGSGPSTDYFKRRALECGVFDRAVFTGRVPFDDLPKCYAAADVFILPSVSRLEAFGIVALEAMASSTPVVVSNIPGVNEVIEDGVHGFVAKPMSPRDIASKVYIILNDRAKATRMGEMGRKRVEEKFTMGSVAMQVERAYEETLAGER